MPESFSWERRGTERKDGGKEGGRKKVIQKIGDISELGLYQFLILIASKIMMDSYMSLPQPQIKKLSSSTYIDSRMVVKSPDLEAKVL